MQHELIKIKYQLKPFFHYFQKQHLINRPDSLKSPVESPSCHNGFPLDLELEKTNNGVATNLFLFWCDWSPIKGLWSLKTKIRFGSTITCREGISTPTTPEKSVPSN